MLTAAQRAQLKEQELPGEQDVEGSQQSRKAGTWPSTKGGSCRGAGGDGTGDGV